jgi:hypothetical protein
VAQFLPNNAFICIVAFLSIYSVAFINILPILGNSTSPFLRDIALRGNSYFGLSSNYSTSWDGTQSNRQWALRFLILLLCIYCILQYYLFSRCRSNAPSTVYFKSVFALMVFTAGSYSSFSTLDRYTSALLLSCLPLISANLEGYFSNARQVCHDKSKTESISIHIFFIVLICALLFISWYWIAQWYSPYFFHFK